MYEAFHLFRHSPVAVTLALMAVVMILFVFGIAAWRRDRMSGNAAGQGPSSGGTWISVTITRSLGGLARKAAKSPLSETRLSHWLNSFHRNDPARDDTDAVFDNIAIWGDESRPLPERHQALDEARTRLNRLADSILAVHAATQTPRRADPDADNPLGSPRTEILLVDDEATLRDLTALSLREMGFIVHRADNAEEAMEIIRGRSGHIDLVLSDVVMPGASGPDLAKQIADSHPEIPVVFMSGYEQRRLAKERMIPPAMRCLSKPFTLEELLCLIREVMATRRQTVAKS